MEAVTTALVLLLAVVASGILARILPVAVPRPLVQIAVGGLLGLFVELRVLLDPELFFVLFLPPLLFLDGWRIPRDEMLRDWTTIMELALGLVVFTVVGMGFFIHWLIPAVPLAVAFALAAILSPTDPIAVSAIAQRTPIPRRMLHIIEGESLLNDASGLVCFRFAVAAAMTGGFSLAEASLSFVWLALGGLAVGFLLTLAVTRTKDWISDRFGEDSSSQILITLLIPFGAYLLAEHLGCSGILAAVSAGIGMSRAEARGLVMAQTRVSRTNVWNAIQYTLNGIIFVLLGEQLPFILSSAAETVRAVGEQEPWWLAVYVVLITAGLAGLRFVWVFVSLELTLLRRRSRHVSPGWRIVAAMSLSGVRGAVTLAGVLTLPLALPDGSPFPARELAIFIAMGVIILSLLAASIALPVFLKGLRLPPETARAAEEDTARIAAARAALSAIEAFQRESGEEARRAGLLDAAASRTGDLYRRRIERRSHGGDGEADAEARLGERIEAEMRLAALKAERAALFGMVRRGELGSETARKLIRELDLLETRYGG
ncbi:Na+/H+ antiporter [Antarcticirhabdus aurantiaca]|uniref:Na+/H+ antiporter n=1 Tax=Antarcticirhabdus aurantiaca TaxID=2606717 RepID=A0ACD4NSV8_9HYPH|nr:Na+/H+ antiporter [Antarcticirhabdus aurantiaca]WAJ29765.1 Na+/H+ antiporter [Jeongeuplla avenae]